MRENGKLFLVKGFTFCQTHKKRFRQKIASKINCSAEETFNSFPEEKVGIFPHHVGPGNL